LKYKEEKTKTQEPMISESDDTVWFRKKQSWNNQQTMDDRICEADES